MNNKVETDLDKDIEELEKEIFGTQEVSEEEEETKEPIEEEEEVQEYEDEVVPVQEETPVQPEVDWEKRFKNYKASTDLTIHDLRSELAKFKSKLSTLQVEHSNLVQSYQEKAASSGKSFFSEEDVDILGEPAVNAINKGVEELINSRVKPLQDEVAKSRKDLAEREAAEAKALAKTNYDKFLSKLAKVVPDYEDLNVSSGFLEYMKEVDEFSGYPRSYLFEKAESVLDVQRVSSFFLDYKNKKEGKKKPLEKAITPSGVRGESKQKGNNTNEDIIITRSFIDQFYNDFNRGKYKGDAGRKEAERIEAMIDKAVISGRIR